MKYGFGAEQSPASLFCAHIKKVGEAYVIPPSFSKAPQSHTHYSKPSPYCNMEVYIKDVDGVF